MKVKLIVHRYNNEYLASHTFPEIKASTPREEVFSIEGDTTSQNSDDLYNNLCEKAKSEARKRGISHVIGLD